MGFTTKQVHAGVTPDPVWRHVMRVGLTMPNGLGVSVRWRHFSGVDCDNSIDPDTGGPVDLGCGRADNPNSIMQLYVPRQGGGLVRLDNLVSIEPSISPTRIDRLDRQRQNSLRASIGPGHALGDRVAALRAAARVAAPIISLGHDWVLDTGLRQFRERGLSGS